MGFRLLVAAETPTDGHLILNDVEEKDKVLMLLVGAKTLMHTRVERYLS